MSMFHRPPEVDPAFENESRMNSYSAGASTPESGADATDAARAGATIPDKIILINDKMDNNTSGEQGQEEIDALTRLELTSSSKSTSDGIDDDETILPPELNTEIEKFVKFLKAPKFNHPLNIDDVSKLYHKFYESFARVNDQYWSSQLGIHQRQHQQEPTELLSKEETIAKDRQYRTANISKVFYNLMAEKLICTKFYDKIYRSNKNLVKDELNRLLNDKFNTKLQKLHKLPISLKENLDLEFEELQDDELIALLEPIYIEMFQMKSPTLKLLKFKKIHEAINYLCSQKNVKINGDFYLPILIYSMIKIRSLSHEWNLIAELNFIKNFKNDLIYDTSGFGKSGQNETDDYFGNDHHGHGHGGGSGGGLNNNEIGELLYILTNLDACLIYLTNVTLSDLKITRDDNDNDNDDDSHEIDAIMIDESSLTYCEDYNMIKKQAKNKNKSVLEYYSSRLQEYYGIANAAATGGDQSISRTIGTAFDSSVKSVFGRFLQPVSSTPTPSSFIPPFGPFSASPSVSTSEIDKQNTMAQLAENLALQHAHAPQQQVISPVSTDSTLNTSSSSNSNNNNNINTTTSQQQQPAVVVPAAAASASQQSLSLPGPQHSKSNSFDHARNLSFRTISNSMSGVIKQFGTAAGGQLSKSNSSLSLHDATAEPGSGTKTRSRGASFIGEFSRTSSNGGGIFSNLEHAFSGEGRRSRGNSLLSGGVITNTASAASNTKDNYNDELLIQLKKEYKEKKFEEMSIEELKKMHENYSKMMKG